MISRRQSGEGRLSLLIWLVILVVIGMVLWQVVPTRIKMAEFQDFLIETTRQARPGTTAQQLRKSILNTADEMEIPLDPKALTVEKTRGSIKIRAEYTIPLDFPGYRYEWKKVHSVDRPVFDV